jgi:3-oxoacyl-[acyl-carrier-protein] synthase-3
VSLYSRITQVAVHLPDGRQSARAIEDRLREHSPGVRVPAGLLSRLYGLEGRVVRGRRVALRPRLPCRWPCPGPGGPRTGEVDLLLFAAVSADVQEPANAHIVAARTGLSCPVFDVSIG